MSDSVRTSLTLIGRLKQDQTDHAAWDEFVRRYGEVLRVWCRRWSLQDADVDDVVQNVIIELIRNIRAYSPRSTSRFRSWLRTVTHRVWYDNTIRFKQPDKGSGDSAVMALLNSVEARDSLVQQLDEYWTRELLQEAMQRVEDRVEVPTWQAFVLMTFDGLSGEEVGQRLGMNLGAVFVARSRVRRLIEEEYSQLDPSEGEES